MARVTAVMPTSSSRQHFWHGAIQSFLCQTFEDAELLILDESPSPAPGDWPDRVHYRWMPVSRFTIGQKRNAINAMVESDLIMHWDDDDWYHSSRIANQVAHMFLSDQWVVGYHDLLYLKVPERTLWYYRFAGKGPYATGTSLMYYRDWWQEHKFPDNKSVGEDTAFWTAAVSENALASKTCDGMIVARSHSGNTFVPNFGPAPFVAAQREQFPEEFLREAGL